MIDYINDISKVAESYLYSEPINYMFKIITPFVLTKPLRRLFVRFYIYCKISDMEVSSKDRLVSNYYKQQISMLLVFIYMMTLNLFGGYYDILANVSWFMSSYIFIFTFFILFAIDSKDILLMPKNIDFIDIENIQDEYNNLLDSIGAPRPAQYVKSVYESKNEYS